MDQFLGEIRIFAGNFAPKGWALCNGQLMAITQNTALFALLGTMYGGDGKVTFALPNLQGRAPMQQGQGPGLQNYTQGALGGTSNVTLLTSQIPNHGHVPNCQSTSNINVPAEAIWANPPAVRGSYPVYTTAVNSPMSPEAVQLQGGNLPHNNMQPYLAMNFIIALQGIFPPRP